MENLYAHVLWKMIEDGERPKTAVAKLAAYLEKRGRASLLPRIARAFARIAAREHSKNIVALTVARQKDISGAEREAKHVLEELGARSNDLEVQMDDSLIGGWRLEGRERLVDASFKKSLLSIYNRATQ